MINAVSSSEKKRPMNDEANVKQSFINRLTTQKALGKRKISSNSDYNREQQVRNLVDP